ncbi:hypothetical protein GCM10025867_50540 (plasmid) [Frondihabitans sucicola]|uniref:Uncharacterized protein n=1 Tax=Frondihabitans sucicola TaxID=1268041 RepID=A0ABM8GWE3_9MICO|nr:hypothetical protein [Frondihabitans sucicola]BDZ52813.1 hypothetical protein GCM10025867_50540 [Frondihabitans sucicola]
MNTTISTPISARPIFYSDNLNEGHERAGFWFLSDDEHGLYWQAVVDYQTIETWWDTSSATPPAGITLKRDIADIPTGRLKYWKGDGTPVEIVYGIGDGTYYALDHQPRETFAPAQLWSIDVDAKGHACWTAVMHAGDVEANATMNEYAMLVGQRLQRPIADVPLGDIHFHDDKGIRQAFTNTLDPERVYAFADGDGTVAAERWIRLRATDALPVYAATTLTLDEYYPADAERPQGVRLEAPIDQPPLGRLKYRTIGGHEVAIDNFVIEAYTEAIDSEHGATLAGWWMPMLSIDGFEDWAAVGEGETEESWWGAAEDLAGARVKYPTLKRHIDDVPAGDKVRLNYMGRDGIDYQQENGQNYRVDRYGRRTAL